jgi:hypothetical protein
MAAHRAFEPMRSIPARLLIVLAGLLATLGLAVLPAMAAPGKGAANGHLILTVDNVVVATAGPGKALKAALAECEDRAGDVVVVVDDVRAAFPNPVIVCNGVTLTSQVAADEVEDV